MPVQNGGMISGITINSDTSLGGYYTFAVYVNGTAYCSITPSGTSGNNSAYVLVNQGDLVCVQCIQAAGAPDLSSSTVRVSCNFTAYGASQSLVIGGFTGWSGFTNTATQWSAVQGVMGQASYNTANGPHEMIAVPGTFKNMYLYCPVAITTGSWAVGFSHNGGSSADPNTVISSGNVGSDLSGSVSVSAGDYMSIIITPTGSPTTQTVMTWAFEFDPGAGYAGYSLGSYDITPIGPTTVYNCLSGSDDTATETLVTNVMPGSYIACLLVGGTFIMSGISTCTFSLRHPAGTTTPLSTYVTGPFSGWQYSQDTIHKVALSQGDLACIQTVSTSSLVYPAAGIAFFAPPIVSRRSAAGRVGSRIASGTRSLE